MDYMTIKLIHMTAVVLSGTGFAIRGIASFSGASWVAGRWAKTLPHIIDTVLLTSALTLAYRMGINPLEAHWLLAKIMGLLVYIGLGMVALKPYFGRTTRVAAWLLALATLGWIASVAITKSPAGFLIHIP